MVSITAIVKNKTQLALGNIIGSNIFNILWVLGITTIIRPIQIPKFLVVDIILLLIATTLVFTFMFTGKKKEIDKWEAITLLVCYILYILFIILRG